MTGINNNEIQGAPGQQVTAKSGRLRRFLQWYWGQRDSADKGEPGKRTVVALVLLGLGVAGSEAYGYVRDKFRDPDAYLVTMKQEQDAAFARLQDSLSELGSAVEGSGREALAEVKGAVSEMKSANTGLMAQLALAKQENVRLSRVAGQQAGVSGGYDLILSENTGLALDASSVLGVQRVHSGGVWVRLSAGGQEDQRKHLEAGESLAYRSEAGRECRVSLLSISGESASFKRSCV